MNRVIIQQHQSCLLPKPEMPGMMSPIFQAGISQAEMPTLGRGSKTPELIKISFAWAREVTNPRTGDSCCAQCRLGTSRGHWRSRWLCWAMARLVLKSESWPSTQKVIEELKERTMV